MRNLELLKLLPIFDLIVQHEKFTLWERDSRNMLSCVSKRKTNHNGFSSCLCWESMEKVFPSHFSIFPPLILCDALDTFKRKFNVIFTLYKLCFRWSFYRKMKFSFDKSFYWHTADSPQRESGGVELNSLFNSPKSSNSCRLMPIFGGFVHGGVFFQLDCVTTKSWKIF